MSSFSWLSRLSSSSRLTYNAFKNSFSHRQSQSVQSSLLREGIIITSENAHSFFSWIPSLLPLALALSAGSLALHSQTNHNHSFSLSEAPNSIDSSVKIGGKSSTDYVVKGSYKEVPQELIDELKEICQDNMTMDYDERYTHGKPENSFHKAVNIPDVVVFPRFAWIICLVET
nr:D-lactate dehydrogenase [cytochrome], mitochondrial [Ipomoea batatas]